MILMIKVLFMMQSITEHHNVKRKNKKISQLIVILFKQE